MPSSSTSFRVAKSNIEGVNLIKEVQLFQLSRQRVIIAIILGVLSCGVFFLLLSWSFTLRKKMLYNLCSDIKLCTHFLVVNEDEVQNIQKKVIVSIRCFKTQQKIEWTGFKHRKLTYTLRKPCNEEDEGYFQAVEFPICEIPFSSMSHQVLLRDQEVKERREEYGICEKEINIPSLPSFLLQEMTSPFYFLQYASVIIWFLQGYNLFAIVIICFQCTTTLLNYIMTRIFLLKLKKLAHETLPVTIFRAYCPEGQIFLSKEIVVGDIIELKEKSTIPCDCILISGELLMNEVSLSGESLPIPKAPVSSQDQSCFDYSLSDHKKHYLFDGTTIYQTKAGVGNKVLARVVRVGFNSFKGQILRSVLFPHQNSNDFDKNSAFFFIGLAIIMISVYIIRAFKMSEFESPAIIYFYRLFDTLTWIIPPFLPIFHSCSLSFSLIRLRMNKVMGVEPQKTLIAGKVSHMCFDKVILKHFGEITHNFQKQTGTLTTNGISVIGFFDSTLQNMINEKNKNKSHDIHFKLFATCHGVYKLDGEYFGDMLDQEMQRFSSYQMKFSEDPQIKFSVSNGSSQLSVLKLFEFDSDLQRMSVIVKDTTNKGPFYAFLKGAPEKVKDLCLPNTIPPNFTQILNSLSFKGFRILALSNKKIEANEEEIYQFQRTDIEKDLTFLGFLVLENKLKEDTQECIQRLIEGQIECKIISGDNPLTTLQTAGECGILDPTKRTFLLNAQLKEKIFILQKIEGEKIETIKIVQETLFEQVSQIIANQDQVVVTGNVLEFYEGVLEQQIKQQEKAFSEKDSSKMLTDIDNDKKQLIYMISSEQRKFKQLFSQTKVFARMRSEQKRKVIEILQGQGFKVGMIGDGANDCEAVKQADIGISFSSADAALSAPFSSSDESIKCVEIILKDGRATLQNNIEIFKNLVLQGVIKFIGCMILIEQAMIYGDFQYTFMSFLCGMPMLVILAYSQPVEKLQPRIPDDVFYNIPNSISIYSQIFIYTLSMIGTTLLLLADDNHVANHSLEESNGKLNFKGSGELNTIIFLQSVMFILTAGITFYVSHPFKLRFYRNYVLVIYLAFQSIYCILQMLLAQTQLSDFELTPSLYDSGRNTMTYTLIITLAASFLAQLVEELIIKKLIVPFLLKAQRKKKKIGCQVIPKE